MKLCKNCQQRPGKRARGLCYTCYSAPGIRDQHSVDSKFAPRGVADFGGGLRLPDCPTTARPGSKEKIEVLVQRAAARLALHHPQDCLCRVDPIDSIFQWE